MKIYTHKVLLFTLIIKDIGGESWCRQIEIDSTCHPYILLLDEHRPIPIAE